jgi:hypothetical protein
MADGRVLCNPTFGDEGDIYSAVTSNTDWICVPIIKRGLEG